MDVAALSDEEVGGSSDEEQVPAQKPTKGSKAKVEQVEDVDEDEEEEDEYARARLQIGHVSLTA